MRKLLLLLALCASAVCAQQAPLYDANAQTASELRQALSVRRSDAPRTSNRFKVAAVAFFACGVADSLTTEAGLRRSSVNFETNPLLRGGTARRQTIAWAFRGVGFAVLYLYRRKAEKAVSTALFTGAGLSCGAAAWNATR